SLIFAGAIASFGSIGLVWIGSAFPFVGTRRLEDTGSLSVLRIPRRASTSEKNFDHPPFCSLITVRSMETVGWTRVLVFPVVLVSNRVSSDCFSTFWFFARGL